MDDAEFEAYAERVIIELDRRAAKALEHQLAETPAHRWPPGPRTEHPSLAWCAEEVRRLMAAGQRTICVEVPEPFVVGDVSEVVDSRRSTLLTVRRVSAPAPFVGAPCRSEWCVALDSMDRYVAGDAYLVML